MSGNDEEATTIVSRRIKPGREMEYANWFGRMTEAVKRAPGFKGVTVILPEESDARIILYRFADAETMRNWENSPERKELMSEVEKYASQTYNQAGGLETWFHVAAKGSTRPQTGPAGGDNGVLHVAIFRFAKEHVNDAMAALRGLAAASRRESGCLRYDVYRGTDDDNEFYVVENWASPAALSAHGRTEAFARFGQGVLVRYATLHDALTARAFDVG